jgi:hypothetical protein
MDWKKEARERSEQLRDSMARMGVSEAARTYKRFQNPTNAAAMALVKQMGSEAIPVSSTFPTFWFQDATGHMCFVVTRNIAKKGSRASQKIALKCLLLNHQRVYTYSQKMGLRVAFLSSRGNVRTRPAEITRVEDV